MSASDAPDWQRVVRTVTSSGTVTDAPDWQRVVVGPGGTPVGGGGELYIPGSLWGMKAQTVPWWLVNNSGDTIGDVSRIYLVSIVVPSGATVSSVMLYNFTSFTPNTADANYVGIYEAVTSGGSVTEYDLVATTAAGTCDTLFADTGYITCPLSASADLTAGTGKYFTAYLFNSTYFSYGTLAAMVPDLPLPGAYQDTRITAAGYGHLHSSLTASEIVAGYANVPWMALV